MIIENSDALKVWLTSCLGRMCDADPAALAKYVLALVKKEKTESELREFCLDQLEVFLLKDTKQFVDLLFETLKTKSYLYKTDSSVSVPNTDATNNIIVNSSKKPSSDSKEKTDSEKDSQKSENVPKSKSLHSFNSRTHSKLSGRSTRESRDRNRSRSHSSSSHSSRSSSRERLKDKNDISHKHKKDLTKPEERRREMIHESSNYSHTPYHLNNVKGSNRCKDYDEKGYCMQGDLCIYDHGSDPVVLESVHGINFGVTLGAHVAANENNIVTAPLDVTKSPLPPPPPTSPPPLPPPPPPLPPLPATGPYIPEPYNPEAPAMNITSPADMSSYWMPPNMHIPSLHHTRSQPLSGMSNTQHILPQHNSKPRSRELIGVPTVEVTESNKSVSLKNISTVPTIKKRKGFDYSRLGPKPKRINYSDPACRTLELKRIPRHLNTISLLNSHFSKFGNITNIEVFYNRDPEAALIQFQTHSEAAIAHSSTDAVLNNRFIQVFWHKEDKNKIDDKEKAENVTQLKEVFTNNSEVVNNDKMRLTNSSRVFNAEKKTPEKIAERSVVYSRGNICRTVYNPAVLKKVDSSTSSSSHVAQKEDKKVNKKLELYKKKQDFLESQLKHQKLILEKLGTAKNDKEKALLKKMLESLGANIKECQQDLKNFLKQCNSQKTPAVVTKTEAEKMLLDAELDLYNTLNKCDSDAQQDTAEILLLKVHELKQKAKALGLKESARDIGLKAKRRHLQFSKSNNSTLLKIDNRPKTLLVSGIQDKDTLKKVFLQFGDVEKIEEKKAGTAVTFNTRKAAETAFAGCKLGNENLSIKWFLEDQHSLSEDSKDANVPRVKDDNIDFVDGDEDEDEEEDSEARSWRR